MKTETKSLAIGALVAAAIAGGGWLNTARLESKLGRLIVQCQEEGRKSGAPIFGYELDCEPDSLLLLSGKNVGIQAEVASAQRKVRDSKGWPFILAVAVFGVLAVPWLWYFLLRRLREIRDALVG